MQSYKDNQLIQTMQGTVEELTKSMPTSATHHVISQLPSSGSELVINGLVWIVEKVSEQHGWMRLRLKKPAA